MKTTTTETTTKKLSVTPAMDAALAALAKTTKTAVHGMIVWNAYDMVRRVDMVMFFDEADAIAFACANNVKGEPPFCQVERAYAIA